jgi:hypothetical protein
MILSTANTNAVLAERLAQADGLEALLVDLDLEVSTMSSASMIGRRGVILPSRTARLRRWPPNQFPIRRTIDRIFSRPPYEQGADDFISSSRMRVSFSRANLASVRRRPEKQSRPDSGPLRFRNNRIK